MLADECGVAKFELTDKLLNLTGPNSIIGRTVVVSSALLFLQFSLAKHMETEQELQNTTF